VKPEEFKNLLLSTTNSGREKHPETFKRFFINGNVQGVPNSYRANGVSLCDWLEYLVTNSA